MDRAPHAAMRGVVRPLGTSSAKDGSVEWIKHIIDYGGIAGARM